MRSDALNPITSVKLYNSISVPTAVYGCELCNEMSQADTNTVDKVQHFIVKSIQGFKTRTRSNMCESMVGIHRLFLRIHIRKFMFLHKLLSLKNLKTDR